MWDKKDGSQTSNPEQIRTRSSLPQSGGGSKLVNIGQSIVVKGELSGSEDLTIDGVVQGKISLKDHNLTIGQHGKIDAELVAKTVTILGRVKGNVLASEKVELQEGGRLDGDIVSQRIAIADGAHFRGKVDMEKRPQEEKPSASHRDRPVSPTAGAPASKALA